MFLFCAFWLGTLDTNVISIILYVWYLLILRNPHKPKLLYFLEIGDSNIYMHAIALISTENILEKNINF